MRREPTKNPHTRPAIATLERLHAELGGAIRENKKHQKELSGQMRHVEAVIKMLDPAYNLTGIAVKRRKPNRWFKHGTIYRRALDVLRAAEGPMTPLEIATASVSQGRSTRTFIPASSYTAAQASHLVGLAPESRVGLIGDGATIL